jgi:glycosyltransferase involved in cell wall biosynthesis
MRPGNRERVSTGDDGVVVVGIVERAAEDDEMISSCSAVSPAARAVSVVIPILNEKDNLEPLDEELSRELERMPGGAEILYVDDGSTDGSAEVLAALVDTRDGDGVRRRLVRLGRNYGQTAALAAGFDLAEGAVVISMDADRQNNPADIPALLAKLEAGFDVVSGWRRNRQDHALTRKLPSRVANRLVALLSGVPLHDYGCTLKAYRRQLLQDVRLYGEMHRFLPVYLARIGARVAELEVEHRPRTVGRSKYGLRRVFKVLLDLVLIRFMARYSSRPMHFFGQAGLFFFFSAAFVTVLMVVFKYGWLRLLGIDYQASFIQTPLPALVATFFLGGVICLSFGVLGEILIRTHHESQGLRPYRVVSVIDSGES